MRNILMRLTLYSLCGCSLRSGWCFIMGYECHYGYFCRGFCLICVHGFVVIFLRQFGFYYENTVSSTWEAFAVDRGNQELRVWRIVSFRQMDMWEIKAWFQNSFLQPCFALSFPVLNGTRLYILLLNTRG